MPSDECQEKLDKANDALDDAMDALDDLIDSVDEMEDHAADSMKSLGKASAHGLGGDWGDAAGDVMDAVDSRRKFERAASDVDRAMDKFNGADGAFKDAMRAWCSECGSPPEDIDTTGATEVTFSEAEVDPIIARPR